MQNLCFRWLNLHNLATWCCLMTIRGTNMTTIYMLYLVHTQAGVTPLLLAASTPWLCLRAVDPHTSPSLPFHLLPHTPQNHGGTCNGSFPGHLTHHIAQELASNSHGFAQQAAGITTSMSLIGMPIAAHSGPPAALPAHSHPPTLQSTIMVLLLAGGANPGTACPKLLGPLTPEAYCRSLGLQVTVHLLYLNLDVRQRPSWYAWYGLCAVRPLVCCCCLHWMYVVTENWVCAGKAMCMADS